MTEYEAVIGLEVHAELKTIQKYFVSALLNSEETQYPCMSNLFRAARDSPGIE